MVSNTVHVLNVSFTLNPRYSFTIQKPASFTCENINDPAPVTITSNSRFTPVIFFTIGATIPAAVVNATVADPVAIRINPAIRNAKTSGERFKWCDIFPMVVATPLSIRICLNPPPAPMMAIIEPTGSRHSSVNFLIPFLSIP